MKGTYSTSLKRNRRSGLSICRSELIPSKICRNFYLVRTLCSEFCTHKEKNECYNQSTGIAVAQLVEAMRYKPEGRRFDSRWCHWNFSLT